MKNQTRRFGEVGKSNWILITAITALIGSALAQTESASKNKMPVKQEQKKSEPAKSVKSVAQSTTPIKFTLGMVESGRIDPRYTGLPAEQVIEAIEKLTGAKKGEFESTADFNARRDAALGAKFLDNSTINDVFAFVVPVNKGAVYNYGIRYEFDADTGELNFYVLPQSSQYLPLNGIGAPDYATNRRVSHGLDQFPLSTKIESKSTYQGSNAYGATVTVEKTSMSAAGIAANKIPYLSFARDIVYRNPSLAVQIKMENSKAAAELPTAKALIVLKLSAPYILYNFSHKEPKRDSPTDFSVQGKYLTGDILGIVFYSGKTGEIFAKLPENFVNEVRKNEGKVDSQ
jgi:hypothetical protein